MTKLRGRNILRKKKSQKGLSRLTHYIKKIEVGQSVVVKPTKELKFSVPSRRFIGKIGTVLRKNSNQNYQVLLVSEKKTLNLPTAHLQIHE